MLDIIGMKVVATIRKPDKKDPSKVKEESIESDVYGINRENVDSKPLTEFLVVDGHSMFRWVNMADCEFVESE